MNYLYNGVELPELPEWDRSVYPCAFIRHHSSNTDTYLYCVDSFEYTKGGFAGSGWGMGVSENSIRYKLENGSWEYYGNPNVFAQTVYAYEIHWSNFDVLGEDGSVYLPASYPIDAETGEEITIYEPIPVGGFTPDPISMTMGWLVGRRIAGQRK